MGKCDHCTGCSGGCAGCGGCSRELTLTKAEMDFLRYLGQIPFLPVIRAPGEDIPVYLEPGEDRREEFSRLLQCLEKKALISLDYDMPLKEYAAAWYVSSPIRGSMALTARGQQVLELLEYQGSREEM